MNTSVSDRFSLIKWELVIIIFIMIMMAAVVFCVLEMLGDGDCEKSAWHIAAASCLRPNKRTASLLEPIFTFNDIWFVNSFIDTNDLSREGPPKNDHFRT